MNAGKVIVATLVIFIAGLVTGGLMVKNFARGPIRFRPAPVVTAPVAMLAPAANPWIARNRELLRRMDRELDLTPEQHARIEKMMLASQERTRALWKPIAPQMNKEFQSVHAEIRDELNPEQKKKFDGFPKNRPTVRRPGMDGTNASGNIITNLPLESVSTNSL